MRYYRNFEEENFFEQKRFSDSHLPTYGDISDLLNISKMEKFNELKNRKISVPLWEKIKQIIYFDDSKNPKLKSLRAEVFKNDPNYIKLLDKGVIFPFEEFEYSDGKSLKDALKDVNIETYSSMYEYFATGANIGTCWITSELLGVMFEDVKSCRGKLKSFINTPTSKDGGHAWISANHNNKRYVVDTSLLLMIPIEYSKELGYTPEREYPIESLINEKSEMGEILYSQYNLVTEQSTKNKASYEQYCRQREKGIKKTKIVDDMIDDR